MTDIVCETENKYLMCRNMAATELGRMQQSCPKSFCFLHILIALKLIDTDTLGSVCLFGADVVVGCKLAVLGLLHPDLENLSI